MIILYVALGLFLLGGGLITLTNAVSKKDAGPRQ
jgi:hypothetical protein